MDCSLPDFRTILTRSCITCFYYFLPPSLLGAKSGSFSQVSLCQFLDFVIILNPPFSPLGGELFGLPFYFCLFTFIFYLSS
jgi:hypothetical protein